MPERSISQATKVPFFNTTYTLDYGELLKVARSSRRYHFNSRQRALEWLSVLGLGCAAFGFVRYERDIAGLFEPLLGSQLSDYAPNVLVMAFCLSLFGFLYRVAPAISGRWIEQRKLPKPLVISADDVGIRWEDDESGHWLIWPGVERIFVTAEAIGLINGAMTYIVSRRGFADEEQLRQFVQDVLRLISDDARSASLVDRRLAALVGGTQFALDG